MANGVDTRLMNAKCWMVGTWTLPKYAERQFRERTMSPGLGPNNAPSMHHTYYQWIPLILLASAISFYVPKLFWISKERGLMSHICEGMRRPPIGSEAVN